jgi:hypothetical protein
MTTERKEPLQKWDCGLHDHQHVRKVDAITCMKVRGQSVGNIRCPECAATLPADVPVCIGCGFRLHSETRPQPKGLQEAFADLDRDLYAGFDRAIANIKASKAPDDKKAVVLHHLEVMRAADHAKKVALDLKLAARRYRRDEMRKARSGGHYVGSTTIANIEAEIGMLNMRAAKLESEADASLKKADTMLDKLMPVPGWRY